jgi:hypothetical protein
MQNNVDLRSKLTDGLLVGAVLILVDILVILLIKPVQLIFGRPGLLVYTVVLQAISVICLEQSLSNRITDLMRGWWGAIGGIVAWIVIGLGSSLGGQSLLGETSILSLMFLFLVVSILWKRVAPLGLRYYVLVLLVSWVSQALLEGIVFWGQFQPVMSTVFSAIGILAGIVFPLTFAYIFLRTHNQIERLNTALVMWGAAMILIYVFRGGY